MVLGIGRVSGKAGSFINFASSQDAIAIVGSVIFTSIGFNLLAPFVARVPGIARYQFLIYLVASFVIYFLSTMIRMRFLKNLMRGASLGILIQGILTFPAIANARAQLELRSRR